MANTIPANSKPKIRSDGSIEYTRQHESQPHLIVEAIEQVNNAMEIPIYFRQGSRIVSVQFANDSYTITELNAHSFAFLVGEKIGFYKRLPSAQVIPCNPKVDTFRGFLSGGAREETANMTSVHTRPEVNPLTLETIMSGYDRPRGHVVKYDDADYPNLEDLSDEQLKKDWEYLERVYQSVCFSSQSDRATMLGVTIALAAASLDSLVPMLFITSGQPEDGKTQLGERFCEIVLGREPSAIPAVYNNSGEQERAISGKMTSGDKAILIDNFKPNTAVNNTMLCSLATQKIKTPRKLGKDASTLISSPVWFVCTGIGIKPAGESIRRSLTITLKKRDPSSFDDKSDFLEFNRVVREEKHKIWSSLFRLYCYGATLPPIKYEGRLLGNCAGVGMRTVFHFMGADAHKTLTKVVSDRSEDSDMLDNIAFVSFVYAKAEGEPFLSSEVVEYIRESDYRRRPSASEVAETNPYVHTLESKDFYDTQHPKHFAKGMSPVHSVTGYIKGLVEAELDDGEYRYIVSRLKGRVGGGTRSLITRKDSLALPFEETPHDSSTSTLTNGDTHV